MTFIPSTRKCRRLIAIAKDPRFLEGCAVGFTLGFMFFLNWLRST